LIAAYNEESNIRKGFGPAEALEAWVDSLSVVVAQGPALACAGISASGIGEQRILTQSPDF